MLDKDRLLIKVDPFQTFRLVVSGGQQYCVASPKHISIHPNNTRAVVWIDDDSSVYVNTLNIVAIELEATPSKPTYPVVFFLPPSC